ncbi:MAG: HAD family hydrolase [Eubacterium sp.]|nr:HAD family hydrolase [Eubacterium sp.]
MKLSGIKAILFDVYGTLISTGSGSVNAVRRILEINGSDIDPAAFYAEWKKLHKQNMVRTFQPEWEIFADDLRELYERHNIAGDYRQNVAIMLDSLYDRAAFPEVKDVLDSLRGRYELIIASNTDTEPLMQNLTLNGLEFDKIFTSEQLWCYKPDVRFYQKILNTTGYTADEVIFVGDSPDDDVAGPKQLGIKTVLIDRKSKNTDFGQDYTITDLNGLKEIL